MFEALGLDADEERVYLALVPVPGATASELSVELGLSVGDAERLLKRIESHGLAARSGTSGRYVAAPPTVALGALLTLARDSLWRAEQGTAALSEQYRAASAARTVGDLVEVVSGPDAVRHRFTQLQQAAESELLAFVTAPTRLVHWSDNPAEREAARRGVRMRLIVERELLEEPGAMDDAERSMAAGEEIRIAESLPIKLVLADRTMALVPLRPNAAEGAVVVHTSMLLDALVALFDACWERAIPLRFRSSSGSPGSSDDEASLVTDMDVKILSLLLTGMTDEAVAKQLDLSARTIQRRIRQLMDLAGARTRLQLGWHASRAGWL
ncbi:helix-turn-helix domain-containing protein [Tenggerimyces flavus]|uniref:Helix-turn-helix domain-containing protein n=1 Tax=Tenggerimyces flavus TaxID=1708749 RepID=A0ABV7Y7R1_9ACTN|nr:helix-turn-helix domain-containing protein [Tenggerimyces flavus]MBM7785243.1 sugar-specific transcriptional regulator TrmB/DNA-binding CsgD family transcriptional regulator [Tenggerimyces flavus]